MKGGARPGAGRPAMPDEQKKAGVYMKLPPWLIAWLDSQPESRAVLVEKALCKIYKLKPPKVGT